MIAMAKGTASLKARGLPPFYELVEAHAVELIAHARKLGAGPDSEDVVQDALLRALRAYPRLQHGEHLRAWLYRITTNAAYDLHARRSRRREELYDAPPDGASATDDLDGTATFELLIDPLPDTARAALYLRFVDDLPYDAIAQRLDCSPEAARQRVSSALRSLRKRLA
jgi:RNA polymerase sigma-70 factor, ECF subfamily